MSLANLSIGRFIGLIISLLMVLSFASAALSSENKGGWHFNFTPSLTSAEKGYDMGGGVDPELRYSVDFGGSYLSLGARAGAYYAKNIFGTMVMPTVRLAFPLGVFDPYVAFGQGYGSLPDLKHHDIATMYRFGVIINFTRKFSLGIEGTKQSIFNSDFDFISYGSMLSFAF